MSIHRLVPLLAGAALAFATTAVGAQTPAAPAVHKTATTRTVTKTVKAAPATTAAPMRTATVRKTTTHKVAMAHQPAGRLVSTTTTTGKKITYDCGKKGNVNKKACK